MSVSFLDLMKQRTLGGLKQQLLDLCTSNSLPVTSWVPGDPTERWIDITPRMVFAVLGGITTQAVRGFFLDFATDPGDPGDLSADQTPRGGFLSAVGAGWFGVERGEATYAPATVVLQNTGAAPATFSPNDLTFYDTGDAPRADGGRPTYRNTASGAYSGLGGTLTLNPGASSVPLPVLCEQLGSYGSATANSLACTTQSFGTLTVTSSTQAVGLDREAPNLFRGRCRREADAVALGDPATKYFVAMSTSADRTPLQRYDGSGPVTIVPALSYVSRDSATGVVTIYYAGASGSVDATDVASANANILGVPLGVIETPIGVVGDCATVGPGSPGGVSATNTSIAATYTAKLRLSAAPAGVALGVYTTGGPGAMAPVFTAIAGALGTYLPSAGTGGVDQVAGAGVIYTDDLVPTIRDAWPGPAGDGTLRAGALYNVALSAPATPTTAIALGHIAVAGTITGAITVVPG